MNGVGWSGRLGRVGAEGSDQVGGVHYWAFISYTYRDRAWGEWLHRTLETWRVPKPFVGRPFRDGTAPSRLYPVFRDRDELPASADLGDSISDALAQSRYLVVVCSPSAATSRWVNEEVRLFKALGKQDRILCLIVDGEPNATTKPDCGLPECFPPALRVRASPDGRLTEEPMEPVAADVRPGHDDRPTAALRLFAGLLGLSFDELRQRERRRRRARAARLLVLVAALMGVGALFWFSKERETEARQREAAARARLAASREETERADRRWEEGRPREAAAWLATALRKDPSNVWAANRLASFLVHRSHALPLALIMGQADAISNILVAPDGSFFLAVDSRHQIRAFDLRTGRALGNGRALGGLLRGWVMRPDGDVVAVLSEEESGIRGLASGRQWFAIFESRTGRPLRGPERIEAFDLVGDTDGASVLVVDEQTVECWDLTTARRVGERLKIAGTIRAAALGASGTVIALATAQGTALLRDAVTGEGIGVPMQHEEDVVAIALGPRGRTVATGSEDGTARVWDGSTGAPVTPPLRHGSPVLIVQLSPDGTRLATVAKDRSLRLFDAATGALVAGPFSHGGTWVGVAFSPGGDALLAAAHGETVRVLDAVTGRPRSDPIEVGSGVGDAAWTGSRDRILTVSREHAVHLWDISPGAARPVEFAHGGVLLDFDLSPSGRRLVTAGTDNVARVWDVATGDAVVSIEAPGGPFEEVRFLDEERIQTFTDEGTLLWKASTGASLGEGSISAASYIDLLETWSKRSPDGKLVLSATTDNLVTVVEPWSGEPVAPPIVLASTPVDGEISPDSSRVVTASAEGIVQLWDARTSQPVGRPMQHSAQVRGLAFSADGARVATACDNATARLWDAASGAPLLEPLVHPAPVTKIRLTPDRLRLVTASGDAAYAWDLPVLTLPVPSWLPDFAEAVALRSVAANGTVSPLPRDPLDALSAVKRALPSGPGPDVWSRLAAWFFADRAHRPRSPFATASRLRAPL